jgi:hypothetical protein
MESPVNEDCLPKNMKRDTAIEEIREIRHQMSAESGHDLDRFFAMPKEDEKQFEPQIRRFHEIERQYREAAAPLVDEPEKDRVLRDKPKP